MGVYQMAMQNRDTVGEGPFCILNKTFMGRKRQGIQIYPLLHQKGTGMIFDTQLRIRNNICGMPYFLMKEDSTLKETQKDKRTWSDGVVLSFDFRTDALRRHYSATSPQGAYAIFKAFLCKHGFTPLKDSDYKCTDMDDESARAILVKFASENEWFPLCISKATISPNIVGLDVSNEVRACARRKRHILN